jgi:hypothetical protein
MNRRSFLSLTALAPFKPFLQSNDQKTAQRELQADVVIIGGGVGGIAAALAAARNGLRVILTEEYDWIGGQLTSQAVPPDEHPWIDEMGSSRTYRLFRQKVRDYYRRNYPLTEAAKNKQKLNPGNGNVSQLCHEPRVALAVLLEMLAPHITTRRVQLLTRSYPVKVESTGDTISAVIVADVQQQRTTLLAPYFIDATETGELLSLGQVEYVVGSESRRDTKEPHAPFNADPTNHQAFTVCFTMDFQDGVDNRIEEPEGYQQWRNYTPQLEPAWPGRLLSWEMSDPKTLKTRSVGFNPTGPLAKGLNLWTYRRIVDRNNFPRRFFSGDTVESDVCLVNWPQNDYWLGNLIDVTREEWLTHMHRARQLSLSLFYWMQTEAPRPDGGHGWRGLRLRGDIVGTEDGLAMAPYIRESRRIKAIFTVTENHVGVDARAKLLGKKPGEFTAEKFPDAVGTGSYRIDLHPSSGGNNYIDVSSLPFQIPLGALIPQRIENLLPGCKNIGTTHITNGCYRLHPVEWSVGEAVGELVAFCRYRRRVPRQVRKDTRLLSNFQDQLARAGMDLDWPEEIARTVR